MHRPFFAGLFVLVVALPAQGQDSAADFYRGRTVNLIVGYSAGGGYDTYTRILARHLGKHVPGNPTIVVQNMNSAGCMPHTTATGQASPRS